MWWFAGLGLWLLKKVMHDSPLLATIPRKELCARHVKDLPAVEPPRRFVFAVRLLQMRHEGFLVAVHFSQPVVARPSVMFPADPPLPLEFEIPLEVEQEVR